MKEQFIDWQPTTRAVKERLRQATAIVEEYSVLGYRLTLRQLYYQMVSRGFLRNHLKEYKNLSVTLTNARKAGYIDWDDLEDRSRVAWMPPDWDGPGHVLRDAARQFRLDRWAGQDSYVEIWCEKDALSSVLQPVANDLHVRLLPVRGYTSTTMAYESAQRLRSAHLEGKDPLVVYLGDHDPSGVDMTRDLEARLIEMAGGVSVRLSRLALNYPQVQQYQLPPNPTKSSDSRSASYRELYGEECWELDALDPAALDAMVRDAIGAEIDWSIWQGQMGREETFRSQLTVLASSVER